MIDHRTISSTMCQTISSRSRAQSICWHQMTTSFEQSPLRVDQMYAHFLYEYHPRTHLLFINTNRTAAFALLDTNPFESPYLTSWRQNSDPTWTITLRRQPDSKRCRWMHSHPILATHATVPIVFISQNRLHGIWPMLANAGHALIQSPNKTHCIGYCLAILFVYSASQPCRHWCITPKQTACINPNRKQLINGCRRWTTAQHMASGLIWVTYWLDLRSVLWISRSQPMGCKPTTSQRPWLGYLERVWVLQGRWQWA